MWTVSFCTFGCKLNQSETAIIVKDFIDHGYRVVTIDEGADVFVINTCTVTGRSDAKCRRAIRHALRRNPETTAIVLGCYPQVASEEIVTIPGVDYIMGTEEKLHIFDHFPGPGKLSSPKILITQERSYRKAISRSGEYGDHTRAFLKIQDGCNRRCSYCIVPLARGPSRSVPIETIIEQTELLITRGYKEIVLTGVHIGKWGKDLSANSSLPFLLERLLTLKGPGRIRLSSLDPEDITDELLECIAESKRICHHFHVPVQSGSDSILTAMDRPYSTHTFRERIHKITRQFKEVGLGTDVIVGFPGESDREFEETVCLIKELPFSYIHVFPFSIRKGTKAASMDHQVASNVRIERARKLRELGEIKKKQFMEKWLHREVNVLLESRNLEGWMSGVTPEYLRVEVPFDQTLVNRIVLVRIEEVLHSHVRGRIIETQIPVEPM